MPGSWSTFWPNWPKIDQQCAVKPGGYRLDAAEAQSNAQENETLAAQR
jgi:hypothetical protein